MDITLTLDATETRALQAATVAHNRGFGTDLTPEAFFQIRAHEFLSDTLVRKYREGLKAKMEASFDQKTPQEQAAILAALGVQL